MTRLARRGSFARVAMLAALSIAALIYASRADADARAFDAAADAAFARVAEHTGVDIKGCIVGGVAPHHDAAMMLTARFYSVLARSGVRRIFLLAPDHFTQVRRTLAYCDADIETSAGVVRADERACAALSRCASFEARAEIFGYEHGIAMHVAVIARALPNATVVPILLHPMIDDVSLLALKERMLEMMEEGDAIVVSMDLSHYKSPEETRAEDDRTIDALIAMRDDKMSSLDIDAPRPANLAIKICRALGARRGLLLDRADASSIAGVRVERGTGYASIVWTAEM